LAPKAASRESPTKLSITGAPELNRFAGDYRTWWVFFSLVAVSMWILHPLVDPYYLHVFEPDASSTVNFTLAVVSGDVFRGQPVPWRYPPYFDAQYFIYAASMFAAKMAVLAGLIDGATVPTPQSLATLAIRHCNLLAYAISTGLSFLILRELSGRALLSLVLTGYILFGPHMLNIDLMRIDHVILALFLAAFFLALRVVRNPSSSLLHVLFGVITAALVLTKVTSILYLLVPVLAYTYSAGKNGVRESGVLLFSLALIPASLLLSARFLPYELTDPGFTLRIALDKVRDLEQWSAVVSKEPRLFYSWHQFKGYGPLFLCAFLIGMAAELFRVLRPKRSFADLLTVGLLGVCSIFGILSYKYTRGLYVLAPIHVAVIALGIPSLAQGMSPSLRLPRESIVGIVLLLLSIGLIWPISEFARIKTEMASREQSLEKTRVEPIAWLARSLKKATRVTIPKDSEWANPPLEDLDLSVAYRFLDFPYLEPQKMADFKPPSLREVEETTDAIVLNDYHRSVYIQIFDKQGFPERRQEWERFFELLRQTYQVKRFERASTELLRSLGRDHHRSPGSTLIRTASSVPSGATPDGDGEGALCHLQSIKASTRIVADQLEDLCQLSVARARRGVKLETARGLAEDAVEHQGVEMGIDVQIAARTLYHGDSPCPPAPDAACAGPATSTCGRLKSCSRALESPSRGQRYTAR